MKLSSEHATALQDFQAQSNKILTPADYFAAGIAHAKSAQQNDLQRFEQASSLELRIEGMLDLLSVQATADGLSVFPYELEEFLNDNHGVKDMDAGVLQLMNAMASDDGEDPELDDLLELSTELASMILVQFATPKRTYSDDASWRSSWGMYYSHWVAAPTFGEAWAKGVAWAERRHEADRLKKS